MKFEMKHIVIILCIIVAGYILWNYFTKEKFGCGCGEKEVVKWGNLVYSEKKYTEPDVIQLGINPMYKHVDHKVPTVPSITAHHPAIHAAPQQSMEEKIKQALKAEDAKIKATAKKYAGETKKYIGEVISKPLQKIKIEYAKIKRKMTIENIIIVVLLVIVIGFILYKFVLSKKIATKIDTALGTVSDRAKTMSSKIKGLFRKGYQTAEATTSDIVTPVGRFFKKDIITPTKHFAMDVYKPTKQFARDIIAPIRRSFAEVKPVQADILGRI